MKVISSQVTRIWRRTPIAKVRGLSAERLAFSREVPSAARASSGATTEFCSTLYAALSGVDLNPEIQSCITDLIL